MLTAKGMIMWPYIGLEMGAMTYCSKLLSREGLFGSIKRLLREASQEREGDSNGDIRLSCVCCVERSFTGLFGGWAGWANDVEYTLY